MYRSVGRAFETRICSGVVDAYRSGWLTTGPRTAELEEAFCEYTGAGHAVPVSSCSAAMHLACLGAGFGPGDEVIVPALTFTSTVSAITHVGATPVFADIAGPTEPWLSVEAVEKAIGERTKGIMTMAYGGHIGETAEIAELAARHGLVLIEDAAHAAGTRHEGRHAGTFGLAGAFSFSASKNLGIGEGGMLVTDDAELGDAGPHASPGTASARSRGSAITRRRLSTSSACSASTTASTTPGRPSSTAAWTASTRKTCGAGRSTSPTARPSPTRSSSSRPRRPPSGEPSSYCLFTGVLDPSVDREEFRRALAERRVQTTVHYPLLHREGVHAQRDTRCRSARTTRAAA